MQDVAKAAGFSQATVSIVLNDTPGYQITLETRRRIEEAAASLNYPMSPSRRRGTAVHKIALVVDGFSSPEILEIAEGARQEAWKTEHLIVVYADFTVPATEAMILEVLMRSDIDGIIYACADQKLLDLPAALGESDIPVVLANCTAASNDYPAVVLGELSAASHATTALIEKGHRDIALLLGARELEATQARLRGFRQAVATADLVCDETLILFPSSAEEAFERTVALLERQTPPTAILCAAPHLVQATQMAIQRSGLSMVGYSRSVDQSFPLLTTVRLPWRDLGSWAVETCLGRPDRRKFAPVKLECTFIDRGSISVPAATSPTKIRPRALRKT